MTTARPLLQLILARIALRGPASRCHLSLVACITRLKRCAYIIYLDIHVCGCSR